jgi:hypothetical protein
MTSLNSVFNSPLLPVIWPIVILILLIFFWIRSGSIIILLESFWRLVAGKAEVKDRELNKFLEKTRDLVKFNFIYGFKVQTTAEMHNLIYWVNSNSISMADIQRAKKWLDINSKEKITLPSKSYVVFRYTTMFLLSIFLIFGPNLVNSKFAVVNFNGSSTWLLLNKSIAKSIVGSWKIEVNQCQLESKKKKIVDKLTDFENEEICKAFSDKRLDTFLSEALRAQKLFFAIFILISIVILIVFIVQISSYDAASRIKNKYILKQK